ncbi:MAG: tRNA uridine-5-carboxymethylaminomethyl(34) synthesis GTPase MnmE, partial [Gammaproteobacteria bacterium]|nr:tRNA uridine-5-carboxymethylaminomethyl(34) synthesis GTPase MnmE [Gammaproteobacteria bacterium]
DTITALATAPGRGGVGIVRVSGARSAEIAEAILGRVPRPRYAEYLPFIDETGATLDEGIALYFVAPNSFTGEDVLELQGHGGPVVMDLLLQRVLSLGARMAQPGEFSQRAYLNDKLDLAQAEAIADLIDASSVQAARSALRSLQGEFSEKINTLVEQLILLRMYVEAAIDFPEEEINFLADRRIADDLASIRQQHGTIMQQAQQGSIMREGMRVVIVGRPNAGKSSLLNALAGRESAIVTDIPGTTRDVLREQIHIDGMPLHIIDTAGLRESADKVEQIGIQRAWSEMEQADRILMVVDDQSGLGVEEQALMAQLPASVGVTLVRNKIDLSGSAAIGVETDSFFELALSAQTGRGLELLVEHLKNCIGYQTAGEGSFMARRRHLDALQRAESYLISAEHQLSIGAGELLAEELRQAQQALSEITGEFSSDDLLGRIFSSFCIGK